MDITKSVMTPEKERGEIKKRIQTSAQLAKNLGFTRNPSEKPTSSYRTFTKLTEDQGVAILAIDNPPSRPEERIIIGATLGGHLPAWTQTSNLLADAQIREQLGLQPGTDTATQEFLKSGGYDQIAQIIQQLQTGGHFENIVAQLKHEREITQAVSKIALAKFQAEFPELPHIFDLIDIYKEVIIFGSPSKRSKVPPAVSLRLSPNHLGASLGKVKLDPASGEPIDFQLEWTAGSWKFKTGNLDEADKIAQRVVTYTLASRKQNPESRQTWRIREMDFQTLLNRLGFQEEGQLAFLRDKVIYEALKGEGFENSLAEYEKMAESLIEQQEGQEAYIKAQIGLIVAQARILHVAGLSQIASEEIQTAKLLADDAQNKKIAEILGAMLNNQTIIWTD
ncbi:hypothetical protein HY385_02920 [Candidatus Daviesbacteria bacterium]|nr:hypothetical protein [Candidatus Daviesbacteria bacterium]